MKKEWALLVGLCAGLVQFKINCMRVAPAEVLLSVNSTGGQYNELIPGRGSPELEEDLGCKGKVCAWWKEGDCGYYKFKNPGYIQTAFWGSIATVTGVAAFCIWYYGTRSHGCQSDDC